MTTIPEEAKEAAARALCRHGTGFPTIEQTLAYVDQKWPRFKEEAEIALTAALPHLPGVGVKKLEWELVSGDHYAEGAGIHYNIYETGPDWWNCVTVKPGNVRLATNVCLDAAKAAAQADYEARILSALEPSAARELALEEGDLNARLKAKGMYSIDEMMGSLPLDKWRVHSGMTDLKFFGEWLERKTRDYCTMHAAYEVGDKDVSDELYEWVLAHYSAFHDVLVNFRAALSSPDHADAGKVEGDGIERAKFYHHQWPMERLLEARRGGLVDHSGGEAWRYEYSHKDEHGKYDILYRPVKNSTIPARLPSAPSEGAE
ncbi:hypothetical protein JS562_37690 [Agrobacterium sp. S2]|nr:hypothetical protein [Agrobacterium sp. S2]